jgi:hypothetical protein
MIYRWALGREGDATTAAMRPQSSHHLPFFTLTDRAPVLAEQFAWLSAHDALQAV